jgi:hypothetical protein
MSPTSDQTSDMLIALSPFRSKRQSTDAGRCMPSAGFVRVMSSLSRERKLRGMSFLKPPPGQLISLSLAPKRRNDLVDQEYLEKIAHAVFSHVKGCE